MDWSDEGVVLGAKRHGENALIVSVLTREHGRHAGLVRGGTGRKARGLYEPGTHLHVHWRARLEEHLGAFSCELIASHAACLLGEADRLAALASACAVCEAALPEREVHGAVLDGLLGLLLILKREEKDWPAAYVRWEVELLTELGFGLNLNSCAATGGTEDLIYVSPKSGCAVSAQAGEPYRDKLLRLPSFLAHEGGAGEDEIGQGLELTGYFLSLHVFAPAHLKMPPSRQRLVDRFST